MTGDIPLLCCSPRCTFCSSSSVLAGKARKRERTVARGIPQQQKQKKSGVIETSPGVRSPPLRCENE